MHSDMDTLRFLVDANLGKVVRWLRALGFDTAFAATGSDDDVLRQAEHEGRTVLTRDRGLAGRRVVRQGRVRAVLVHSEVWREQLEELALVLPLAALAQPFSRCPACNAPLASCPLARAWKRVPSYVYQTQQDFQECPACGRVYWRGTHWSYMSAQLQRMIGATRAGQYTEGNASVPSPESQREGEGP